VNSRERKRLLSDLAELEAEISLFDTGGLSAAFHRLAVLANLTDRECDVLVHRLGVGGEHLHTLEELGKTHKVTRERIRQIEAKALRKLGTYLTKRRIKELEEEAKSEGVEFKFIA
tara:strand:- start:173 stop:520 length:348 start_codon:yes stop_codon:yes gene_type:complete